jgi:hypothetical protein
VRAVTAGQLAFSAHTGTNRVRFAGRISATTKLPTGSYTLSITATSSGGQRSVPQLLNSTIAKG